MSFQDAHFALDIVIIYNDVQLRFYCVLLGFEVYAHS